MKASKAAAHQIEQKMLQEIDARARAIIKPRPRWMPAWLYTKLANLIINKGPI